MNTPCAVLYVNSPTYIGGAEVSLLTLIRHLTPERFRARLLTGGAGSLEEWAGELRIATVRQEFPWFSRRRPWRYGRSIWRLARMARRARVDLIHTNCDHCLRYVMWASWLTGIPYVSHVRDFSRGWFEPQKVAALNRAARVIANSKATARACIAAGIEPARVVTIYNPIEVADFANVSSAVAADTRRTLAIPADALVIGLVGQVQPMKGHAEFVGAALEIAGQVPEAHFLLVGAAPPDAAAEQFAEEIRRRVQDSTCADRFHFVGFRADVQPLMSAIDILVVPSWNEPFGRVAVEGMAAGCTVVGTLAGGLPEIITNEVDGLLVPPRDASALAAALLRLCRQPEARASLAERGRQTAHRFGVDQHIRAIEALYESVLVRARRAS